MKKNNGIILFFSILKFLIPFLFIHGEFELHRDEYLYLSDARHLAWGFIEIPPLLALLGRISLFFGNSYYAVYFWGSLFGALTTMVIGKIVIRLKGNEYAVFIACLAFLVSGFLRMHILFQPNFLDVFFWTLSSYFIICWIQTDDKRYIYYIGICFALGMLSKYTAAFFILGFWVSVLLTPQRKWLANKHFYFAMLISLLIALPNFLWQINHGFPVMHHMKLLENQQLQYLSRPKFLLDQVINTLPCFIIWLLGLYWLFFTSNGRRFIAIGIIYLVVIFLLLLARGKSYYAMGMYPALFGIGGLVLEKVILRKNWKVLKWAVPISMLIIVIPVFPVALPFASPAQLEKIYHATGSDKWGVLNWEDGKTHALPQDFADMLGWKEMAVKVNQAWLTLDSNEQRHTLIFCDNYGQAGAVNYFGKPFGLPEAYSDNASFLYWLPENLHIDNMILVTDDQEEMQHPFMHDFKTATLFDSVVNPYAREKGSLIIVLKGANEGFNKMFARKIEIDKEALK
jgi:hypothetical protein